MRLPGGRATARRENAVIAASGFTSYLRLAHFDSAQQRQRFYVLVWQPGLFGGGALVRSWGLVGARGRTLMTRYLDRRAAQPVIERLVQRQLGHGYRVVQRS